VEPEVLEQQGRPRREALRRRFDLGADAVRGELDAPMRAGEERLEPRRDRPEAPFPLGRPRWLIRMSFPRRSRTDVIDGSA
jgi:hypothetical protein